MNAMNSRFWRAFPVMRALFLGAGLLLAGDAARATDGAWSNTAANANWSASGSWQGGVIADGAGSTAWFTNNISAARTVTIDGAVSSRTNGILNLGDLDAGSTFTIAASGGGILYLSNTTGNAQINERVASRGDIISAPIVLLSSVDINNASTNTTVANTLTFSGSGISAGTAGTKTISSVGTGFATNTFNTVISDGAGVVAMVQNNAAGTLRLNGANTFSGGVTIDAGTVILVTALSGGGSSLGTITLGDTSGSANATLLGGSFTSTNTIVVRAGSSGVLTMGNNGNISTVFRGPITLNTNLTLVGAGSGTVNLSGNVTGIGGISAFGPGTVYLGGSNSFTGGVALNSGTLTLLSGASWALGTGSFAIASNATLSVQSTVNILTTNQQAWNSSFTFAGNTLNTGPGTVTLGTNLTLTTTSGTLTVPGALAGAYTLTKAGTATLVLSGSNSLSGGVTLLEGTLTLAGGTASWALGTGNLTIASNATLQGSSTTTLLSTNQQAWNSSFTVGNAGLNMGQGTVTLGTNVTVTGAGANTVFSIPGSITGAYALAKAGAGTFTLKGSNSYSGGTTVDGGTLAVQNADALGSGSVVVNSGGILQFSGSGNFTNHSAVITGVGGVQILNTSLAFTMPSSNAYTGGTLIQGNNRVFLGDDSALGTGTVTLAPANNGSPTLSSTGSAARTLANNLVFSNGNNLFLGNATNNGALTFNGNADLTGDTKQWTVDSPVTFAGAITNGAITKLGPGSLTLSGANTFAGGISNSAGTLVIANDGALGTGQLTFSGGSLSNAGNHAVANVLNLLSNAQVSVVSVDTLALAGAITNLGGLTKLGAGTLALNGNSSYSGATLVSNGTLRVNGASTGAGGLSVFNGATLGGTGSLFGVTLASGAHLAPGNSIGTLTVSNLTINTGSLFDFELAGTNASDRVVDLGTLTLAQLDFSNFNFTTNAGFGAGTYTLIDAAAHLNSFNPVTNNSFYGFTGTIYLGGSDGNDLVMSVISAIPEPSALLALGGGLALLVFFRRREAM